MWTVRSKFGSRGPSDQNPICPRGMLSWLHKFGEPISDCHVSHTPRVCHVSNVIFDRNQFGPSDQNSVKVDRPIKIQFWHVACWGGFINWLNQSAIDTCHMWHVSSTCQMKSLIEINLDRPIKIRLTWTVRSKSNFATCHADVASNWCCPISDWHVSYMCHVATSHPYMWHR